MPAQLCVGLNKIALLRSSRGRGLPDLCAAAEALIEGGCEAILVHCWSDARHVRLDDVAALARLDAVQRGRAALYLGSDPRPEIVQLVRDTPAIRALILTPFDAAHLTTQRGFGPGDDQAALAAAIDAVGGRRAAVFVDPDLPAVRLAAQAGAYAVELNCRRYVDSFGHAGQDAALAELAAAADEARALGLSVHAAHDLDAHHLPALLRAARPDKVSVGHSFIAAAVIEGARAILPRFLAAARSA